MNAQSESQVHYLGDKGVERAVRPNFSGVSESVRRSMKSNRGKDTQLEIRFRRALRDRGLLGYRINVRKLPGKPDVAWIGRKIAVFLHGCFWHGCPTCGAKKNLIPTTRAEYWSQKVETNKERDARNRALLESDGWTVLVYWEHEVRSDLAGVIRQTEELVLSKGKSLGSR